MKPLLIVPRKRANQPWSCSQCWRVCDGDSPCAKKTEVERADDDDDENDGDDDDDDDTTAMIDKKTMGG